MRGILFSLVLGLVSMSHAAGGPVPSGPLKSYEGPEGEIIHMVEVNGSKEMLVRFVNIGGELDNQTKLYLLNDMGNGKKDVYFNKKRGSKTETFALLVSRNGSWTFYDPTRPGSTFGIKYSKVETKKMKLEDILNSYKP